jgi:hypothetical protein
VKPLPETHTALVIRTAYSDEAAWEAVRDEIRRPVDGFFAYVEFVDDVAYDGLTKEQLIELCRGAEEYRSYVMVVDATTLSHPDHPVLVLDVYPDPAPDFRAIPSQIQSVENNLSIANMDFEDFAQCADATGIFRGFPRS